MDQIPWKVPSNMEGNSKNLVNQNEYLLGVFLQHQKLDARECAQGRGGGEIVDLQMYLNWSCILISTI